MKLADTISEATRRLNAAGVDNPGFDARLLIALVLGLERSQMISQAARDLNHDELQRIAALIARREAREPVARILGEREFWGLPFKLNEATLEPRADSETLVEAALKDLTGKHQPHILDLGTGSGCLLISLLCELPHAVGIGVDIAPRAVEQAQFNAEQLGVAERCKFQVGNWIDHLGGVYDGILSNPPYIASDDIPMLMPEVRDHDPLRALNGGVDGLDVYRQIIPGLMPMLKPQGFAIMEVGKGQADQVVALYKEAGFADIQKYTDFSGIERCVMGWAG